MFQTEPPRKINVANCLQSPFYRHVLRNGKRGKIINLCRFTNMQHLLREFITPAWKRRPISGQKQEFETSFKSSGYDIYLTERRKKQRVQDLPNLLGYLAARLGLQHNCCSSINTFPTISQALDCQWQRCVAILRDQHVNREQSFKTSLHVWMRSWIRMIGC